MSASLLPLPPQDDYIVLAGRRVVEAGPSFRGWHHASLILRCPQLWAYHSRLRLKFPERGVLVRGSLFHVGFANFHRRLQALAEGTDPDVWATPIEAMTHFARWMDARGTADGERRRGTGARSDDPELLPITPAGSAAYSDHLQSCIDAMLAYAAWWQRKRSGWSVIATEYPMSAAIEAAGWSLDEAVRSFLLTQRLDVIVRDPDGYVVIVDGKTRGKKEPKADRLYNMDGQFQGYWNFGKRAFGTKFGGLAILYATFKGVGKIDVAWQTVEAKPWAIGSFADTIRWAEVQIQLLQEMERRGTIPSPYHYPKVFVGNGCCEHLYGPCEGWELCSYGPGGLRG